MSSQLLTVRALLRGPSDYKMLTMIVDTGATTTIIPREMALAIGCAPGKTELQPAFIITASGIEFFPLVRIPELACLGCTVRDIEVACHTIPSRLQTEGLLGIDFLRHVPAFQQFKKKILELTQP